MLFRIFYVGFTKEETENLLIDLDFLEINNVVALRGDANHKIILNQLREVIRMQTSL